MSHELLQPNIDQANRALHAIQSKTLDVVRANTPKAHTERMMRFYDRIVPQLHDKYQNLAVKARPYVAHVAWGLGIQATLTEVGLFALAARGVWLMGNHIVASNLTTKKSIANTFEPAVARVKKSPPTSQEIKQNLEERMKASILTFLTTLSDSDSTAVPEQKFVNEIHASLAARHMYAFLTGLTLEELKTLKEKGLTTQGKESLFADVTILALKKVRDQLMSENQSGVGDSGSEHSSGAISLAMPLVVAWIKSGFTGFTEITGLPTPSLPKDTDGA